MLALIVVAVVCFVIGAGAAVRWLPALLDDGPVGRLVSFVVCALFGGALAYAGIYVDQAVRELEHSPETAFEPAIVGRALSNILINSGTLVALAVVAYLLAPKAHRSAPVVTDRPS